MKYIYVDRLKDFEFHDSFWTFKSIGEDTAEFSIKNLNVHKDALCEEYDFDMQIEFAEILFKNPKITELQVHFGKTEYGTPLSSEEYKFDLIKTLKGGVNIHYLGSEDNRCEIEFHRDSFVSMTLIYSEVIISFEKLSGKAWYE